jgi:hypothetical protein
MGIAFGVVLFMIFCVGIVALYKRACNVLERAGTLNPLKRKEGQLAPLVRSLEREGFFAVPSRGGQGLVLVTNDFLSEMVTLAAKEKRFAWELPRYELVVREFPESSTYSHQLCSRSHAIGFNWQHN